jgi:hypothetical protein
LPVGLKSANPVKTPRQKYFALSEIQIVFMVRHPASTGGAYRDRRGRWMWDAMDVLVSPNERNKRGWQSRVVLIPRR